MPVTLAKTISKIQSIPNSTNARLVKEMYEYLKSNGASERHQHQKCSDLELEIQKMAELKTQVRLEIGRGHVGGISWWHWFFCRCYCPNPSSRRSVIPTTYRELAKFASVT